MLRKITFALIVLFFSGSVLVVHGQQAITYNLVKLLRENMLETYSNQQTTVLDSAKQEISTNGIDWLKGVNFKDGTIDVDLRGKDVFLQSFLGIAFHGRDTATYEVIFFRPFRFHNTDLPTRKWSVQYMSMPEFDYAKLRKEHPGVYENEINLVPGAEDWFHATIVIKRDSITVYVNHSVTASLKIKKLSNLNDGKIGLWSSPGALSGDFANLRISE